MSDLTALKGRVESASGPDREIDADIYIALVPRETDRSVVRAQWSSDGEFMLLDGDGKCRGCWGPHIVPRYTASLDASLALVERRLPSALIIMGQTFDGIWYVSLDVNAVYRGQHRRLPLALLSALLTALQDSQDKEKSE